jgi:hypothetical protein
VLSAGSIFDPDTLLVYPFRRVNQSVGQQVNVKAEMARVHIHRLLFRSQQVEEQRPDARLADDARHVLVAGAMAAAPAAMREEDDAACSARNHQFSIENRSARRDLYTPFPFA